MSMKADGLSYAKTLAGSAELRLSDVLVLGRGNDPYFIGTPSHYRDGEWFAIHRFRDQNPKTKTQIVASEADTALREKWSTETSDYRERAAEIQSRIQVVYDEYQPELEVIAERMETDLEPVNQELEGLREEYCGYVDQFEIELPPRPEPEIDGPCDDPLYDSERDHVDQLLAFQRHEELA